MRDILTMICDQVEAVDGEVEYISLCGEDAKAFERASATGLPVVNGWPVEVRRGAASYLKRL